MTVNILNKKVDLQLDSGSDLSIINIQTWKRLKKPTMHKTNKSARAVTGNKIIFEGELTLPVTLNGTTKKVRIFVHKTSENLFGTDWMEQFKLWDQPINKFCRKVENSPTGAQRLKDELKEKFPEVFSSGLGRCTKAIARFQLKENALPVFKKKRNILFVATENINKELDRLEKARILSKVSTSEWAAPTVYVTKKTNQIRVCADFSTGLNAALKDYHYPLPTPEEVFNKLNGGKILGGFKQRVFTDSC